MNSTGPVSFNVGAGSVGAASREQPMLQAAAQTIAAEASNINDRLEAILHRLHPPQPRAVENSKLNDGPSPVSALFSMLGAAGSYQQRSHQLLAEIESLV